MPASKPRRANCVWIVERLNRKQWIVNGTSWASKIHAQNDLKDYREMNPSNKFRLTKYTASK